MTGGDTLVILRSVSGKHAAKQITLMKGKKGKPARIDVKPFGKETHFSVSEIAIGNVATSTASSIS